ncbi:acyl-CoA carboxylase subunit epsilon [Microvirga sp. 0TCS3.31]
MTGEQETATDEQAAPVLRIVNADATPEEIAALVAVFSTLGADGGEPTERPRSSWSNPARGVRRTHRHGSDAWRASGLPR